MGLSALLPELLSTPLSQLTPEQRRLLGLSRPATDEEIAGYERSQQPGAPADFSGPVFENPNGAKVSDDTESGIEPLRLPAGVTLQKQNFSGTMPADVSNPPRAQILGETVGARFNQHAPAFNPNEPYEKENAAPAFDPNASYEKETAHDATHESAPATTEQPSALSRLGHNFLSGLGVTSNEDAKQFFEHPINTALQSLNAQGELAKKAKAAYDRGDYKGAVMYGLNYLVPFIGQQTAKAGEQLSEGDIAGGVGRTLGVAIPLVAASPEARAATGDVASSAASAVKPALRRAGKAATALGESLDPDVVGLVSPRAAHALRLSSKVGKVASKLGTEATPEAAYPGAPLPESPAPELLQGNALAKGGRAPAPEPAAGLGKIPVAAEPEAPAAFDENEGVTSPQVEAASETEVEPPTTEATPAVQEAAPTARPVNTSPANTKLQLEQALGAAPEQRITPGVTMRNQRRAAPLPEGFTPVKSSSLVEGYKYNPATEEMDTVLTNADAPVRHAGITQDLFEKFEAADSKGSAWNKYIKNGPGTTPLGKVNPDGTLQPRIKPKFMRSVVIDPETGQPEFSDVLEAKQKATPPIP